MVLTGLVLLVIGTVTILSLRRPVAEGELPLVVGSTSDRPTATSSAPATPAPSSSGSVGGEESAEPDATAEELLDDCRAKVEAADDVRDAAEEGVGHWAAHVQAQTDADAGKISLAEMNAVFERTKDAGSDDAQRYRKALDRYHDADGSCRADQDGAAAVAKELRRCADRAEEQQPVLEAASDAMGDWLDHLQEMRRSESGKIHDPEQLWLLRW